MASRPPSTSSLAHRTSFFSESGLGASAGIGYNVLSAPAWESFAERLQATDPGRFAYRKSVWQKFPDGVSDHIELGGYTPLNRIRGSHVLFLASFHDNDAIMSQFQALVCLAESFVQSLTIMLPFYPMGTMERVTVEGQVATANTIARMLSCLPGIGRPIRIMLYDLHTLQNRFYFHGHALASLHTCIPLIVDKGEALLPSSGAPGGAAGLDMRKFDAIAFPDEGAAKRFGGMFPTWENKIICGKVRIGDQRVITIHDGCAKDKRVLIVDDMVRSGGTLIKCCEAIKAQGAASVSAYCTHAAGTLEDILKFGKGGAKCMFDKFYVTNTVPTVTDLIPEDEVITVLDILPLFLEDL